VDAFLLFFEQMPTWQKVGWVMACLALSWVLEGSLPLVQLRYRKWRHAAANSAFLASTLLVNAVFGVASVAVVAWTDATAFGLLHVLALPVLVELALAIVLLDLAAQYWAHWLAGR
jgi:hypothetical protein